MTFSIRNTKYTWLVHANYGYPVGLLIGICLGLIVSKITHKLIISKKPKEISVANPKGGGYLVDCINPDEGYEVTDLKFVQAVKPLFDEESNRGPLIISPQVLFLAQIILNNPGSQLDIFGVSSLMGNVKSLRNNIIFGASSSLVVTVSIGLYSILGPLLTGTAGVSVVLAILIRLNSNSLNCNEVLRALPLNRWSSENRLVERPSHIIDIPTSKLKDSVIVRHDDESPVQIVKRITSEECSIDGSNKLSCLTTKELEDFKAKTKTLGDVDNHNPTNKLKQIYSSTEKYNKKSETSKDKYIPLSQRTSTLQDLEKDSRNEVSEQNSRQSATERFRAKRESINNERIKNEKVLSDDWFFVE